MYLCVFVRVLFLRTKMEASWCGTQADLENTQCLYLARVQGELAQSRKSLVPTVYLKEEFEMNADGEDHRRKKM